MAQWEDTTHTYVYIYIYINTHTHIYIYIYIYIYIHIYMAIVDVQLFFSVSIIHICARIITWCVYIYIYMIYGHPSNSENPT